jgi:putative glycosyltransferase (TIGR04372 family)
MVVIPVRFLGHLACEPDLWVKDQALGTRPKTIDILLASRETVANRRLLSYWRRHFWVVEHPFLCRALESLAAHGGLKIDPVEYVRNHDTARHTYGAVKVHTVLRNWGERPPVLALGDDDRRRGREVLSRLGMPDDAWFVCVQNREPTYDLKYKSEWPKTAVGRVYPFGFRDCAIANYRLAIDAIVKRGGWVVRMGEATTEPLPPMKQVIDYAHLEVKSDWMDVFLCASCRFFLGNSSGLFFMSSIFGVPVARANSVPMASLWSYPDDLVIPKLMWSSRERAYLSFPEVFGSPLADIHYSFAFEEAGIEVLENDPGEIRDLACEMLDRLEGTFIDEGADERLQQSFKALFQPHQYCYGTVTRVGRQFLRKYAHLMEAKNPSALQPSAL